MGWSGSVSQHWHSVSSSKERWARSSITNNHSQETAVTSYGPVSHFPGSRGPQSSLSQNPRGRKGPESDFQASYPGQAIESSGAFKSRQALARAAKSLLAEEDAERRSEHLHSLSAQGLMSRCWGQKSPQLWVVAVEGLPPEPLKFTLNAVLDTLPTNSNLRRWGKKSHDTCPLCSSRQSLSHVMNNCPTAMNLCRYSRRHDKVLEVLGGFIREHLSPSFGFTIDLPSSVYSFPQHITPTDSRPDILWWCEGSRSLWLLELTVSFEPQMEDAQQRKQSKYQDLVEASQAAGYTTELITVVVVSRGLVDASSFRPLARVLNVSHKDISNLCIAIIRTTLLESHKVWCSRNVCI